MELLILDKRSSERLTRERRERDVDRYDEVWDGVYVVSPGPNDEHQDIVGGLTAAFFAAVRYPGLGQVRPSINVSDREEGWEKSYREPDVAVFLAGTSARNLGTHWVGGPDFAVEILSRNDRSRQKMEFYATIGVRELLIVDRHPWSLELLGLRDGALTLIGRVEPGQVDLLVSDVLPLGFRLIENSPRPIIEVVHRDGVQRWAV